MARSSRTFWASSLVLLSTLLIGSFLSGRQAESLEISTSARLSVLHRGTYRYLLERNGVQVGFTELTFTPTPDSLRVQEHVELRLPARGGGVQAVAQTSSQVLDSRLRLLRFTFLVEARNADGQPTQTSRIEGLRTSDREIAITVWTGGEPTETMIPAGPGAAMGASIWPRLALLGALEPGRRLAVDEIDPMSLSVRPTVIEITDSVSVSDPDRIDVPSDERGQVRAVRLLQETGGLSYDMIVTSEGLPVSAQMPLGIRVEPATVTQVTSLRTAWLHDPDGSSYRLSAEGGDEETIIAASAIRAGAAPVIDGSLASIRVRVRGGVLPADADGDAQHVSGDTVLVRSIPLPMDPGYALGPNTHFPAPVRPYVQPQPFIESDRAPIRALADSILGGRTDPTQATQDIVQWVHDHLEKAYTVSLPSAIEVLQARSGDCNEHTLLAVALLRAAGIPARAVSGLALVNGYFFFHAWPEVWLGETWVPVDPTFGTVPADAARLRLSIGAARLNTVALLIGRMEIDVLDTEPTSDRVQ